jgi:hypothetical protein
LSKGGIGTLDVRVMSQEVVSLPPNLYGAGSPGERVTRLAAALATSPILADMGPTSFVVRQHPEPALAAIGEFGDADRPRLGSLRHMIESVLPTTRYITYEAAEAACRHLAEHLVERVGSSPLRHAQLRPIPRGGHIVLGMLGYILGLNSAEGGNGPLIVVDDCAISGARFRQFLDGTDAEEEIVFAHLYSAPELREAIELTKTRVRCVSGEDLVDLAPERLGPDHAAWQQRWRDRTAGRAYWHGQP